MMVTNSASDTGDTGFYKTHAFRITPEKLKKTELLEDFNELIKFRPIINNLKNLIFLPEWLDSITIDYRIKRYSKYLGSGTILSGEKESFIANINKKWYFSNFPDFTKDKKFKNSEYEIFLKKLLYEKKISSASEYIIQNYSQKKSTFSKINSEKNELISNYLEIIFNLILQPQKNSLEQKMLETLKINHMSDRDKYRLYYKLSEKLNKSFYRLDKAK